MNIPRPASDSYTIYSKSGCLYCTQAVVLLKNEQVSPLYVDCDEFLLENKEEFLKLMKSLIGYEYRTFPMIFKNGHFIGGYTKSKEFYEQSKIVARGDFWVLHRVLGRRGSVFYSFKYNRLWTERRPVRPGRWARPMTCSYIIRSVLWKKIISVVFSRFIPHP